MIASRGVSSPCASGYGLGNVAKTSVEAHLRQWRFQSWDGSLYNAACPDLVITFFEEDDHPAFPGEIDVIEASIRINDSQYLNNKDCSVDSGMNEENNGDRKLRLEKVGADTFSIRSRCEDGYRYLITQNEGKPKRVVMSTDGGNDKLWRFDDDSKIESVRYKGMVMSTEHDFIVVGESKLNEEQWSVESLYPSNAALLVIEKQRMSIQMWEPHFVNPPYNYAITLGCPGTLDHGCLTSAAEAKLAKSAMHACDESMSLLLGSQTSVGTLRALTDLIAEQGVDRIPGQCCFDTPTTNGTYLGTHYNPHLMECKNNGPWHLGITAEGEVGIALL